MVDEIINVDLTPTVKMLSKYNAFVISILMIKPICLECSKMSIGRIGLPIERVTEITTIDINSYVTYFDGMEIYNQLQYIKVERRVKYAISIIDFSSKDSRNRIRHYHVLPIVYRCKINSIPIISPLIFYILFFFLIINIIKW